MDDESLKKHFNENYRNPKPFEPRHIRLFEIDDDYILNKEENTNEQQVGKKV